MNFSELESLMSSRDVNTLADIARTLETTPQAVSNWKARDQVPYHIVAKLNRMSNGLKTSAEPPIYSSHVIEKDTLSVSDILLPMSEQLKVILLVPFITVFLTFTYVQFIQQPKYVSSATILLPKNTAGNLGGLAGLASQFGVSVPTGGQADLSSPSLIPELLVSRTFAEKVLAKEFFSEKYGKKLTLLALLTHGDKPAKVGRDTLITNALGSFRKMIKYEKPPKSEFSRITVTALEPLFAKELVQTILIELEASNRYYKSQAVNEKISFIENRIVSVKDGLEKSEQHLKDFSEQNRQILSPALLLIAERLNRDVDTQKNVYMTLKQQLELAKIEAIQVASILQIVDPPQTPLGPFNINLRTYVLLAGIMGLTFGILLGFIRSYVNNSDISERRKLRRVRNFLKKKSKDVIFDRRVSFIVSVLLLVGLPIYLGNESKNPVFFGMYSPTLMLVNTVYVLTLISSISLFIYLTRKKT